VKNRKWGGGWKTQSRSVGIGQPLSFAAFSAMGSAVPFAFLSLLVKKNILQDTEL